MRSIFLSIVTRYPLFLFFFFNDPPPTEISPLSLHDALPIFQNARSVTPAAPLAACLLALPATLVDQGFALRPETEADVPFLRRLYASTRWEELAPIKIGRAHV